jgi:hypothetical protein
VSSGDTADDGVTPIGELRWRAPARIRGRVRSLRVQPWAGVATLEAVVVDESGGVVLVFLGRRRVAGLELGSTVVASGMVGQSRGYLAILNPTLELVAADTAA